MPAHALLYGGEDTSSPLLYFGGSDHHFSFIFVSEKRMSSEELSQFLVGTLFSLLVFGPGRVGRGFQAIVFSLLYSLVESNS